MPVSVDWYNEEHTIIYYLMEGNWDWNEFYPVYEKAIAMECAQPHRVDVIVDTRSSGRFPMNLLTHVQHISDKQPANIGLSIIVSGNQFLHTLYSAGCKFHPNIRRYFEVTNTMEEALTLIATQRARLLL